MKLSKSKIHKSYLFLNPGVNLLFYFFKICNVFVESIEGGGSHSVNLLVTPTESCLTGRPVLC